MDPNETLKQARQIATEALTDGSKDAIADLDALATLFDSLDVWLTEGGFLPDAWHERDGLKVRGE